MPAYSEHLPEARLSRWVECAWWLRADTSLVGHRVPPDGCVDIVYDPKNGLRAIGTMTREQRFDFASGSWMTGVRFRPGMAGRFLGIAPVELTDSSLRLEDLWGNRAKEAETRLEDARSVHEATGILAESLSTEATVPTTVQRAIELIVARNGNVNLESVACQANLSPRQFRRRCLEESGLSPKLLCRVLRFRHACRMAHAAKHPNWPEIALRAEYFDQAHFIRDFHDFTGLTPMAVFSNTAARNPVSIAV